MRAANGGAGCCGSTVIPAASDELRHGGRHAGDGRHRVHHGAAGRRCRLARGPEEREKRRGVAGMVYASRSPAPGPGAAGLDEVTRMAQKAANACRSIGMALSPCTVPQAGRPTFQLGEDEMEMGMGIHGEPGIWRDKIKPADAITDEMMDRCWPTCRSARGDRVRCWSTRSARRRSRNSTSCSDRAKARLRRPRRRDRHAARRPLRHLDGDDRRHHDALSPRRRTRAPAARRRPHCAYWTVRDP